MARCVTMQDTEQKGGLCLRVIDIREIVDPAVVKSTFTQKKDKKGQPLLVVLYNHDDRTTIDPRTSTSVAWLARIMDKSENTRLGMKSLRTITADLTEQHMILELLRSNTARLDEAYHPVADSQRWPEEKGWKLSFLLPLVPLNAEYLSRYQIPNYCSAEGCDNEAWSSCASCGVIWYCSRGGSLRGFHSREE